MFNDYSSPFNPFNCSNTSSSLLIFIHQSLNIICLSPLRLAFIFHLHSLFLLYQGSGNKDKLCLVCWSCLSSSPLPTVLKERTRRWLNTLNMFYFLATCGGVPQWHVVKSDDWATVPHRSARKGRTCTIIISSKCGIVWVCLHHIGSIIYCPQRSLWTPNLLCPRDKQVLQWIFVLFLPGAVA